jgi:hypothetical protein
MFRHGSRATVGVVPLLSWISGKKSYKQYFEGKVRQSSQLETKTRKTKLTEDNTPKGEYNDDVFPSLIAELNVRTTHLRFLSVC